MSIDLIAVKLNIELGAIPMLDRPGEVFVARVGPDLLFTRLPEDEAIEAVAGWLDMGYGTTAPYAEEFDAVIRPRMLRGALERLSPERRDVSLGEGKLAYVDRDEVVYQAPCGEEHRFAVADLERVLEEFGGS